MFPYISSENVIERIPTTIPINNKVIKKKELVILEFERARQILNSEETITVLHNGAPIWIESLNQKDNTVKVKPMNEKGIIEEVPVAELYEA